MWLSIRFHCALIPSVLLCLGHVWLLLTVPAASAGYDNTGGDDQILFEQEQLFEHDIAVASNGDIYVAVEYEHGLSMWEIRFFRSQDGGVSWDLWGYFQDIGPNTWLLDPKILIAEGVHDRLYLTCRQISFGVEEVIVAWADLADSWAGFDQRYVLSDPGLDFGRSHLATDAENNHNYNLFLVASGGGGVDPDDIYFTRSTDQGDTWESPYIIGNLAGTDRDYVWPRVCYGFGNYIHVTWFIDYPSDHATNDDAVRYRRAANAASGGISDWGSILAITSSINGENEMYPTIAASPDGNDVALTYMRAIGYTLTQAHWRMSNDQGATWPVGNTTAYGGRYPEVATCESGVDWAVGAGISPEGQATFFRPTLTDPLVFGTRQVLSDDNPWNAYGIPTSIALDPTHGHRAAMCWTLQDQGGTTTDYLFFDAEWLGDAGYPNVEDGFPVTLPSPASTPPAVVDLNDAELDEEIVFSTEDGNIHIYNADGTVQPGWPIDIGYRPDNAPVAVGDLDGDGSPEIVAGDDAGRVFAFNGDGSSLPGFPVDLGTGADTYVAIGMIGPPGTRSIAVTSGRNLFVLDYQGRQQGVDFPVTFHADHTFGPAIGDVDNDGMNEIVTSREDFIHVHDLTGVSPAFWRRLTGEVASDAPTLADLDLDGDLEIALPTNDGDVYLMHHDFSDFVADPPYSWPFTVVSGSPVNSVSFADNLWTSIPELSFSARDQEVYLMYPDGRVQSRYPHNTDPGWFLLGAPIVDGLNSNGSSVVIGSRDEQGWAWSNIGWAIPGWPKALTGRCNVSPASGDIDLDGRNEYVFVTTDELIVFDVNYPPDPSETDRWPMYGHDPMRTGCLNYNEATLTGFGDLPGPTRLKLAVPTPNPTRRGVVSRYELPARCAVTLGIHDAQGRLVQLIRREEQDPGVYAYRWDGEDNSGRRVAAGVYFVRLRAVGPEVRETLTRKITLLP